MTEKEVATESKAQDENGSQAEEETELESQIIRQIEYYFGDANLPRDKFLREQIKLDEGWIPLEVLTRFNRLAKLSTDLEVLATALNKSTSGLVEVSEDNKKVRRNPELPVPEMNEERRKELLSRTVYAKGFPKDVALDDLLAYFKTQGDVDNVIMRRYVERPSGTRKFKGSVFATFKDKEQAEKFVAAKGLKYGEGEVLVRWQEEYLKEKEAEYAARKEKKGRGREQQNNEPEREAFKLPTGTVLKISGGFEKMSREHIRDTLTALGAEVAYIDFKLGDPEGYIRLTKEDAAKEFITKVTDGKIKIEDNDVEIKLVEGDEEKTYLDKSVDEMSKRRKNSRHNNKRGGKSFRGNRQNRKRKQGDDSDAPPAKVKAD